MKLDEHGFSHEEQINRDLKEHAISLTKVDPRHEDKWSRAQQTLDELEGLYRETKYESDIAKWRRELVLAEVKTLLEQDNLDEALKPLNALKTLWIENDVSNQYWAESASEVGRLNGTSH